MTEINSVEEKTNQKVDQGTISTIDWENYINDWGLLVTKHPLRYKIWTILNLFGELNVTQISKYVKESKSTVSRIANEMEDDYLIVSKERESKIKGRIASKVYRIDLEVLKNNLKPRKIPKDARARIQYYRDRIVEDRAAAKMVAEAFSILIPFLDHFEQEIDKLDNVKDEDLNEKIQKKVDPLYNKFLQGELEPMYFFKYITKDGYKIQEKLYMDETMNGDEKCSSGTEMRKLTYEERDELKSQLEFESKRQEKDFAYYTIKIPMKDLYIFHEMMEKERKKFQ